MGWSRGSKFGRKNVVKRIKNLILWFKISIIFSVSKDNFSEVSEIWL